MAFRIKDKVWLQQSFMLPDQALDELDKRRRVLSSAGFKFVDTTLGGNFAINAPPSFTRYADIRQGGNSRYGRGATNAQRDNGGVRYMMSSGKYLAEGDPGKPGFTTPSAGIGRFYSEGLDDYGQDLIMRFGVPEYNSLIQFFSNFYSVDAGLMARTGRTSDFFSTAGKAVGFLLALPLQPLILGGQIIRFLANVPASKYYYLKPAMYPYWQAVNTIANGIAVNMGIMPNTLTEAQQSVMGINDGRFGGDQKQMLDEYAKYLPDIFAVGDRPKGATGTADTGPVGLDIYAIATRAQRIANKFNTELQVRLDSINNSADLAKTMKQFRQDMFLNGGLQSVPSSGIDTYRKIYLGSERNQAGGETRMGIDGNIITGNADQGTNGNDSSTGSGAKISMDSEFVGDRSQYNLGNYTDGGQKSSGGYFSKLGEMFEAERRDGSQFVTFRVNYTGSTGESFSNSVEEPGISSKFNSTSSQARSARFDFADGNISDGPLGSMIGGVISAGKAFLSGALEGIQMGGLVALAGNAFVDIPKTWSGSTANLPRAEYTIKLRSPYGSRMSRLMNLYIPLAMLLAAALPLSTGKRSFTSPFICEAFCRGRHAIRLGMIDSMSITRGVGNMGWNQDGEALGIDVTFSIVDMSTIMHMPIQANFSMGDRLAQGTADLLGGAGLQEAATYIQRGTYDDDNSFTDYLAVLGSLSWQDMVYANRRWRLARYRQMQNWNTWKSPARVSMWAGQTTLGRLINAVSLETDRPD